jgi:hypothetical protein
MSELDKHAAISPGRSWKFSFELGLVGQSLPRLSYHFAHIAGIEFDRDKSSCFHLDLRDKGGSATSKVQAL